MARFVKHEPCPKCGSRNNLGRYDDGSAWCFVFIYSEGKNADSLSNRQQLECNKDNESYPKIPEDASKYLGTMAVEWLSKYGIGVSEAMERGVLWSLWKQQLIFNMDEIWQARNFKTGTYTGSDGSTKKYPKYFTSGPVQSVLPIYQTTIGGHHESTLVVVEDCTSALKIARQSDSMPILGTYLSHDKINRIARLYSRLIVWLDHDKYKEAVELAEVAKKVGLKARVICTEEDPKCHTNEQIKEYLK